MRTRLLAGLVLVAGAVTACSGTADRAHQPVPVQIAELHMVSGTDGWASTSSNTLIRTTDGGHTWHSVENCPTQKIVPVGTGELWTAGNDNTGTISVCHTTNGGDTWQTSSFHTDADASIVAITAPDAHDVWVETGIPQGMHSNSPIGIFGSTDTGKTWQEVASSGDATSGLVASCAQDLAFAGATTGWLVGGCAQNNGAAPGGPIVPHIQTSTDGGRHWSAQPLSGEAQTEYTSLCTQQDDCVFSLPTFAGANGIVVGTAGGKLDTSLTVFATNDTGRTWSAATGPSLPPLATVDLDVASPQVVLALVNGTKVPTLNETMDGGRTWGAVPVPPTNDPYHWTPQFVTAYVGFLSENNKLEATVDDGRHWRSISPVLVR